MPMFSLDFGSRKSEPRGESRSESRSRSSSEGEDSLRGSLKKTFGQPYYKVKVTCIVNSI